MLFTREMVPAVTRGRTAVTTPKFAIAEVGQGRFNSRATEGLLAGTKLQPSNVEEIFINYDEKTRKMSFSLDPAVFKAKAGTGIKASIGEKSKQLAFTMSWVANQLGYDFKASGNQSFALDSKEGSHVYSFTFPTGTLENTTVKRGPRKAKAATANGKTVETPGNPVTEDVE